jgi:hypothetical protein
MRRSVQYTHACGWAMGYGFTEAVPSLARPYTCSISTSLQLHPHRLNASAQPLCSLHARLQHCLRADDSHYAPFETVTHRRQTEHGTSDRRPREVSLPANSTHCTCACIHPLFPQAQHISLSVLYALPLCETTVGGSHSLPLFPPYSPQYPLSQCRRGATSQTLSQRRRAAACSAFLPTRPKAVTWSRSVRHATESLPKVAADRT